MPLQRGFVKCSPRLSRPLDSNHTHTESAEFMLFALTGEGHTNCCTTTLYRTLVYSSLGSRSSAQSADCVRSKQKTHAGLTGVCAELHSRAQAADKHAKNSRICLAVRVDFDFPFTGLLREECPTIHCQDRPSRHSRANKPSGGVSASVLQLRFHHFICSPVCRVKEVSFVLPMLARSWPETLFWESVFNSE